MSDLLPRAGTKKGSRGREKRSQAFAIQANFPPEPQAVEKQMPTLLACPPWSFRPSSPDSLGAKSKAKSPGQVGGRTPLQGPRNQGGPGTGGWPFPGLRFLPRGLRSSLVFYFRRQPHAPMLSIWLQVANNPKQILTSAVSSKP